MTLPVVAGAALMALAFLLWVAPTPLRWLARVDLQVEDPGPRRRRVWGRKARIGAAVLFLLVGVGLTAGRGALVVAIIITCFVRTVWWVVRIRAREKLARQRAADVSAACAALATEVRAGRPANAAISIVADDFPVLRSSVAAMAVGMDPAPAWRREAAQEGGEGLLDLARAWGVSRATGAPLGPTLDQIAEAMAARDTVHSTVAAELSATRSTGTILAVLPFVGLFVALAIGAEPAAFLLGTTAGNACALAATFLACLGIVWTEHIARPPRPAGTSPAQEA